MNTFFGVEELPGDGLRERALEELYRMANGGYYNALGDYVEDEELKAQQLIEENRKTNKMV